MNDLGVEMERRRRFPEMDFLVVDELSVDL